MIYLKNKQLAVEIVDPVADQRLLGSRYCTGGYIFQISDNSKGNLLGGPMYPDRQYNAFDGQGAPEVFVAALHENSAEVGDDVLVPGVGRVQRTSPKSPFHVRDNPSVRQFCVWEIERSSDRILMEASHKFDKWDIVIERTVALEGRSVVSETRVRNIGPADCPIRWFPHPFFPFPGQGGAARFEGPVAVPDNPGYFLNSQGIVEVRGGFDWEAGLYQPVSWQRPLPFGVDIFHQRCTSVRMRCDYVPSFLPLWANDRTFSVEPYFEKDLESGGTCSWKVEYEFGKAAP
jgi:hypothetical protein